MRDPLGVSEIDALRYGWEDLRTTVKHQQRFFFVLQPQDDPGDDSGRTIARGGRLLEELARLIREHDLVADVEARCPLYRVRPHSADGAPATARALGAPPADYASQSRMSPAGIPMFYAADELETALAETLDPDESPPDAVTIARFETTEACRIVDLSRLAEVPSIFDDSEEARTLRPPLLFLHGFAPGCQRRHQEDNQIHIEHVPTQVVSEYLRHVFRDAEGRMVRGLACESSRRPGARNVVLFLDNDRCVEPRRASAVPKKGSPSRVQRSLDLLRSTARRTSRDSPSSAVGSQLRVVADPRRRTSGPARPRAWLAPVAMPDVVNELLATERAIDKLGTRDISVDEAEQVPHNRHTMIRNPSHPGDSGKRQLLVGCTDGGRVLTLFVERTIDPTTWLIVTGWSSTVGERNLLRRTR